MLLWLTAEKFRHVFRMNSAKSYSEKKYNAKRIEAVQEPGRKTWQGLKTQERARTNKDPSFGKRPNIALLSFHFLRGKIQKYKDLKIHLWSRSHVNHKSYKVIIIEKPFVGHNRIL